jgi:Phage tail lysozyme
MSGADQFTASSQTVDGYYADNLVTLAQYLIGRGYSPAGAAGVAGAAAGESSGNPESQGSGGAGLIGWTPPSSAAPYQPIVTGNVSQDFSTQLADVDYYNAQQGLGSLKTLNAQTDPVQAADYYSQVFERPLIKDSDVRPSVARYVYDKVSGLPTQGNLSQGTPSDKNSGTTQATDTSFSLNPLTWLQDLISGTGADIFQRLGLILFGGALVLLGVWMLAGKQAIRITTDAIAPEAAVASEI